MQYKANRVTLSIAPDDLNKQAGISWRYIWRYIFKAKNTNQATARLARNFSTDTPPSFNQSQIISRTRMVRGATGERYQSPLLQVRKRYRYRDMMTPYEKLRSLPEAESYLKLEATLKKLDAIAAECSDNDAAQRLDEARTKLFQFINKNQQRAA
jgi:hypothetical protein